MKKLGPKKQPLEQILKALGDPVRLSVVQQLLKAKGLELACGTFKHDLTKATFSHHLGILREAGIVQSRREGVTKWISLNGDGLDKTYPGLLDLLAKSKRP